MTSAPVTWLRAYDPAFGREVRYRYTRDERSEDCDRCRAGDCVPKVIAPPFAGGAAGVIHGAEELS